MSDRVLKCFNCGGEGHYAKDCQNGTIWLMQSVLRLGPTPTEAIKIMIGEEETEKEQEEIPASIADKLDISQGSVMNRGRNKDQGKRGGDSNIVVVREERVLFATTAKRVVILLETVTLVNDHQFRAYSLML